MNNETKQTPIETLIEKLEEIGDIRDCTSLGLIQLNIDKNEYIELKKQAKEMEKEHIEKLEQEIKLLKKYIRMYENR